MRQPTIQAPDSQHERASLIRDALARTHQRMDARFPEALDAYALGLSSLGAELHGCASAVCGTQSADAFRESLRGDRALTLAVVYRLAGSDRWEAKRGVQALVAHLAARVGLAVTPAQPAGPSLLEAAADLAEAGAAAVAETARAAADGEFTHEEVEAIAARTRVVRQRADAHEAAARASVSPYRPSMRPVKASRG